MLGAPCLPTSRRRRRCTARSCLLILTTIFLLGLLLVLFLPYENGWEPLVLSGPGQVVIKPDSPVAESRNIKCTYHTCVDVYRCPYDHEGHVWVYVYPHKHYVDDRGVPVTLEGSQQFQELIEAIKSSFFYTSNPNKACLFIPPIDLLNQNRVRLKEASKILRSLPFWRDGANHVLFNMLPGSTPDFNTSLDVASGKAILAGGGFNSASYRVGFDVSVPLLSPGSDHVNLPEQNLKLSRPFTLAFVALRVSPHDWSLLKRLASLNSDFLLLRYCDGTNGSHVCLPDGRRYLYPRVLQLSSMCLIVRGARLVQPSFYEALGAACVPVVVADEYVMPFEDVIDWSRASIRVPEHNLSQVMEIVRALSPNHVQSMRLQVHHIYRSHMSSMADIALTTLQILNDRIFLHTARTYDDWNDPDKSASTNNMRAITPPLYLPVSPPHGEGFTAVVLTYDRVDSLFTLIKQVSQVSSLSKIIVVWNNKEKPPPPAQDWPRVTKPLKVIQTHYNRLSNRFYPYDDIDTECVLALDDDIIMMTKDELEFGFQVWREFPDRLVGFPSRLHLWDNTTSCWKYESEWTSAISMVLTGVTFYHKYYSFVYTNNLPGDIKSWVDKHMNCEDIAMNFLIANISGKGPIKITPRKKFKCTDCSLQGSLSADLGHLVARSECVQEFADTYGMMPLKTVEFRADPVLYKDDLPSVLTKYRNMGDL